MRVGKEDVVPGADLVDVGHGHHHRVGVLLFEQFTVLVSGTLRLLMRMVMPNTGQVYLRQRQMQLFFKDTLLFEARVYLSRMEAY